MNIKKGRPRTFDRDLALSKALDVFWRRGFEPATIGELCAVMGINPPSLYSAFGNKSKLFIEAVDFYQKKYWDSLTGSLFKNHDFHSSIRDFFSSVAKSITLPNAPKGCMIILSAINVTPESQHIVEHLKVIREGNANIFYRRIEQAINDKQIPPECNARLLSYALNNLLEGLSIRARDGMPVDIIEGVAIISLKMLPEKID